MNDIRQTLASLKAQLEIGRDLILKAQSTLNQLGQAGKPIELDAIELNISIQLARVEDKIRYMNRTKL